MLLQCRSLGAAHQLQQQVGSRHSILQQGPGTFEAAEVGHPDAPSAVLVLVRRADTPPVVPSFWLRSLAASSSLW